MTRDWNRTKPAAPHRFGVGEVVAWSGPELALAPSTRFVRVLRLLPPLGVTLQYRIEDESRTQEHLVLEHTLKRGAAFDAPAF